MYWCIFCFCKLFNWRLITLQYCSGFYHTFTWISHGCTCVPHWCIFFSIGIFLYFSLFYKLQNHPNSKTTSPITANQRLFSVCSLVSLLEYMNKGGWRCLCQLHLNFYIIFKSKWRYPQRRVFIPHFCCLGYFTASPPK